MPGSLHHGRDARIVVAVDAEGLAHSREVGVGGRCADAPAVAELKRPEVLHEARRLRPIGILEHLVAGRVGPEERDDRVEHAELHVRAFTRAFPGEQRGGDRLRRVQRGHLVGCGLVEEVRFAGLRVGLVRGEAPVGLDHGVVRTLGRVGTDRAEARQRRVDDPFVDGPHVVVSDPEPFHDAGAEVLHEHVGTGDELQEDVAPGAVVDVERE